MTQTGARSLTVRTLLGWVGSLAVAVSCASDARAGNDELPIDIEAALLSTAVTASVSDAGAMYYNPAGLVLGRGTQIDATGTVLLARFHHVPSLIDAGDAGTISASSSEWLSLPTVVGYVRSFAPRLRAGLALFGQNVSNTRFSGQLDHPEDGATTRWNLASRTETFRMSGGLTVSYLAARHFSLGATMLVVYASRYQALQFGGGRNLSSGGSVSDVSDGSFAFSANSYGSRWGLQAVAGLRYDAPEGARLGLSVLTPALSMYGTEETASLGQQAPNPQDPATHLFRAEHVASSGFQAALFLPAKVRLGLAWPWPTGYVEADLEYIAPLHTSGENAPDWKSLVNVMVGAKVFVREDVALGAGLFTDRSPYAAPFGDDMQVGADYYGGTLGLQLFKRRRLAESEAARELVFSSSFAVRYAFARAQTRGLVVPASYEAPLQIVGDAFAETRADVTNHELSLNIGAMVGF